MALGRAASAILIAVIASAACASVDFDRDTATSGTFTSKATAFTLLSLDFPGNALLIARDNAADAGRPNMVVRSESLSPNLSIFNWLLEIIGVRWARVTGTWGYPSEPTARAAASAATAGSSPGSSTPPAGSRSGSR